MYFWFQYSTENNFVRSSTIESTEFDKTNNTKIKKLIKKFKRDLGLKAAEIKAGVGENKFCIEQYERRLVIEEVYSALNSSDNYAENIERLEHQHGVLNVTK